MKLLRKLAGVEKLSRDMHQLKNENSELLSEVERMRRFHGRIATPENSLKHLYNRMHVDPELRAAVLDIRHMDKMDGRVKVIHKRMARDVTKGGLMLKWQGKESPRIIRLWKDFRKRLQLNNRSKLQSDARGCAMEGNLPLQWVISKDRQVIGAIRMPTETIVPQVDINGRFVNMQQAYKQIDAHTWEELHSFPFWQLTIVRLDPDNYDDQGCLGRPYLDANRTVWQKLTMTEEDLVIRRRVRAPQKLAHMLEGASEPDLQAYEEKIRGQSGDIQTNFFSNKKGSVTAIEGDANLDQIADVAYLLDTFFAGSPAPKGLFGYVGDLNRDVLEDLKKDYFEEIDGLQDGIAYAYEQGFRLDLLLRGINPDAHEFSIAFAERKTETRNQRADFALKLQALGVPDDMVHEEAGLDVSRIKAKRQEQDKRNDPYPDDQNDDEPESKPGIKDKPTVSVTPNNAPKGESATTISTRTGNS